MNSFYSRNKQTGVRATAVRTGSAGSSHTFPSVEAQARGEEAEQMVLLARHFGIPVIEDAALAQRLSYFSQGARLPQDVLSLLMEALRALYQSIQSQRATSSKYR